LNVLRFFKVIKAPLKVNNYIIIEIKYDSEKSKDFAYLVPHQKKKKELIAENEKLQRELDKERALVKDIKSDFDKELDKERALVKDIISANQKFQKELDKERALVNDIKSDFDKELEKRIIKENTLLETIKKLENDLEVQRVKETTPKKQQDQQPKKIIEKNYQEVQWGISSFDCLGCGKKYKFEKRQGKQGYLELLKLQLFILELGFILPPLSFEFQELQQRYFRYQQEFYVKLSSLDLNSSRWVM